MFSNRGYKVKLTAALALIAGLGIYSGWRGGSINPALWRCVAEPARWDGVEVRASGVVVLFNGHGDVTVEAYWEDDGLRIDISEADEPEPPDEEEDGEEEDDED